MILELLAVRQNAKPNIIFILTDDQGFSDVSWRNKQVRTPNLDALRRAGVTIEGAYSQTKCTPSRIALMTGKYAWKVGMPEDRVIDTFDGNGLSLDEKLLPEYLKDAGYDTHFFGKWHLGYCDDSFRPQNRGFDTGCGPYKAFGFMGSGIDYSKHWASGSRTFDYWNQNQLVDQSDYTYTTDDFVQRANQMLDDRNQSNDKDPFFIWLSFNVPHSPIEAPSEAELEYFSHIQDSDRREYLAALYRMDYKVGELVSKLKETGEFENTIIVYTSDNGPVPAGSAWPMRGQKGSSSEGGVRVPAFITGPGIKPTVTDRMDIMHLMDWTATIMDFAGLDLKSYQDLDGISFKNYFVDAETAPRTELFHYMQGQPPAGTLRRGNFKLAFNTPVDKFFRSGNHTLPAEGACSFTRMNLQEGIYQLSDIASTDTHVTKFKDGRNTKDVVMFNIADDPYELQNVFEENLELGIEMIEEIKAQAELIRTVYGENKQSKNIESQFYPEKTGITTSGWCNPNDIKPKY